MRGLLGGYHFHWGRLLAPSSSLAVLCVFALPWMTMVIGGCAPAPPGTYTLTGFDLMLGGETRQDKDGRWISTCATGGNLAPLLPCPDAYVIPEQYSYGCVFEGIGCSASLSGTNGLFQMGPPPSPPARAGATRQTEGSEELSLPTGRFLARGDGPIYVNSLLSGSSFLMLLTWLGALILPLNEWRRLQMTSCAWLAFLLISLQCTLLLLRFATSPEVTFTIGFYLAPPAALFATLVAALDRELAWLIGRCPGPLTRARA